MLRGFIIGLIVGLATLAGLMVLFPMTASAPMAPEAVVESGGNREAAPATEGGAVAPKPAAPDSATQEAPASPTEPEAAKPDDQTQAPLATPGVVASETAGVTVETREPDGGTRLPTVARAEDTLKAPMTDPSALPAWRRNAVAFDASDDRPLLAIVLTAIPVGGGSGPQLSGIGAPLTLAVPARSGADAQAAQRYRKAGFETLLLLAFTPSTGGGIAPNLSDAEVAETVRGLIESFDSVVGLANPGAPRNTEIRVARIVMRELADAGLGYLHAVGGAAGTEVRVAEEASVPLARNVRLIDPDLSVTEILQNLDLAAFDARRRGASVAMGAPTIAMVQALTQWAKEHDGRAARLAPFSAVLARLARSG